MLIQVEQLLLWMDIGQDMLQIHKQKAFTLIELVISMVILGVIGLVSFMVIVNPIQGFNASMKRSELVVSADNALRKIDFEIKNALPNSVRVTSVGSSVFLEFVPLKSSGRYLSQYGADALVCPIADTEISDNNILSFNVSDTCFVSLGAIDNISNISAGDFVVVYNLGDNGSSDFYVGGDISGNNKSKVTSVANLTNSTKVLMSSILFPNSSPSNRFFITGKPITYECNPTTKTIKKYWNYGVSQTQPTTFAVGNSAILVDNVSSCYFTYSNSLPNIRNGVLTSYVNLNKDTNNIFLYGVSHVNNVP